MRIVVHDPPDPLAPFPPVFRDLLAGGSRATAFFRYDPSDPESFARRAAWLDGRETRTAPREAVAAALEAQNRRWDAHPAALAAAARLADPRTVAVVTGQQPGLLGGPLYTLLKAVTALRLARELEGRLGRPVVAVFWLATEDHDFAEAARVTVVDRHGRLRRLELPSPGEPRRALGHIPVPPQAESVLRELADALGEAGRRAAGALREHAERSASLGEWCARLLAQWLSPHGLVLLDPLDPALRAPLKGLLAGALLRREAIHRELAAAATRLERRGYVPVLTQGREYTHLFAFHRGQRLALLWQDGVLADRHGQLRLTVAEAARTIDREPERFSPGVVLRPMAQDWLLPTLAQVVGPGEAQYLAQLREVYRLFGLEMPVIVPRLSLTLVPPPVTAILHRHGVGAAEFLADPDGPTRRVLQRLDEVGIPEAMARLRAAVEEAYDEASRRLAPLASLAPVIAENRERVRRQLAYLERKAWQHLRRRHRGVVRDLEAARHWLCPEGQLQERVLGAVQFVACYGPELVQALLRLPPGGGHRLGILEVPEAGGGEEACVGAGAAGHRTPSG